jgi:hypothetical protein
MKFSMGLTEQRVTLRISPETDTEAAFLRVLCDSKEVERIREERNAHSRYHIGEAPNRDVVAQAAWVSELDYNLTKVLAIEITQERSVPSGNPSAERSSGVGE